MFWRVWGIHWELGSCLRKMLLKKERKVWGKRRKMEKKMEMESELVRVIAVNHSGVSFLLKYTNTEDREESAIIRVPNEPGKTVMLT